MNITLNKINRDTFNEISDTLNNDLEVGKYVKFSDYKNTYGIYLNDKLIGLFSLHLFINFNVTMHIALLKEYRNKGIGYYVLDGIIKKYGINYPNSEYFMIDVNYSNEKALNSFNKMNLKTTNEFDELMIDEGGEFFKLYKKENPYYVKRKELCK